MGYVGFRLRRALLIRAGGRTLVWALAAFAASAALSYWMSSSPRPDVVAEPRPVREVRPMSYAPSLPVPGQVRRAYDQVRSVYSEDGLAGVMKFASTCRAFVAAAPSQLDFCIAFALDGAALAKDSTDAATKAWSEIARAEQVSLARRVLPPGADPAARVEAVDQLTRSVVAPPAELQTSPPARGRGWRTSHRLRAADAKLQVAYRRALARSADPARLKRQQARWRARVQAAPNRAAVARLYRVRLRELTARPQRLYPPPLATLWRADVGAAPEMPPY